MGINWRIWVDTEAVDDIIYLRKGENSMELTMNMGAFELLSFEDALSIDGGINWDRVFGGTTVYLGATMAICAMTGPIGWGVAATYLATCAAAGAYIGYGLAT